MLARLRWTTEQDATIREMRAARASWEMIAAAVGICRTSVICRAREIGASTPRVNLLPVSVEEPDAPRPDGTAAPAGAYWRLICAGTCLADAEWIPGL